MYFRTSVDYNKVRMVPMETRQESEIVYVICPWLKYSFKTVMNLSLSDLLAQTAERLLCI